ncbi:MAG: J domain-containing protein [Methylococcaceae bacterium]
MAKFRTHYDNLNVSRNAPVGVVRAAYKALCQNYHPDKFAGGPDEALRIMKIINGAYAVLSDTDKRAEHDQWIDKQERQYATHEAQRIMQVFTEAYVAPSVMDKNIPSDSYFAAIYEFWENARSVGNNLQFISAQTLKKLNWMLWFAGVVGIVCAATIFYAADLKTTTAATALANRDVEETLKKAEHTLNNGQVAKALPLYLQLAKQGNADAQFQVGLIYANGQGIPKDENQAAIWFGKAAKQGHREAQTKLGYMYATGKGVELNYNLAAYWCYKSAEQGDVVAQYYLGLMYAKGQGMMQDNSLAVSWFSKAAAQGDARAQYNLGIMYAKGVGVARDNKQAAVLYSKAAKQGLAEAIAALKQLDR